MPDDDSTDAPEMVGQSLDSPDNVQMNVVGYVVAGGIALVLLPVLPLFAIVYAIDAVASSTDQEARGAGA